MQTTLRIDDKIYREAKAEAARKGITLTRFIEEALRLRLQHAEMKDAMDIAAAVAHKEEIERRNQLMEALLQHTAHFRIGAKPTREEMNER